MSCVREVQILIVLLVLFAVYLDLQSQSTYSTNPISYNEMIFFSPISVCYRWISRAHPHPDTLTHTTDKETCKSTTKKRKFNSSQCLKTLHRLCWITVHITYSHISNSMSCLGSLMSSVGLILLKVSELTSIKSCGNHTTHKIINSTPTLSSSSHTHTQ